MKLISMTDFVEDILEYTHESRNYIRGLLLLQNYLELLKQPLKLEMFVPCDEEGNVLETPTGWGSTYDPDNPMPDELLADYMEYKEAKGKVLFEGFEVTKGIAKHLYNLVYEGGFICTYNSSTQCFLYKSNQIEGLIGLNPTLTPSAIKQIGI